MKRLIDSLIDGTTALRGRMHKNAKATATVRIPATLVKTLASPSGWSVSHASLRNDRVAKIRQDYAKYHEGDPLRNTTWRGADHRI